MADALHLLEDDTARLLLAGAAASQGDPGLRARTEALAPLAAAAPALARLAQQVGQTLSGGPAALLDLAAMAGQVRGTRARPAAGPGDLAALPPVEALPVFLAPHEIEPIYYTLLRGRRGLTNVAIRGAALRAIVKDAAQSGAARDARLLPLWLDNLMDYHIGEVVREKVAPLLGEAAARPIEARLDLHGNESDAALLRCLVAIRGKATIDLLRRGIAEGSSFIREAALAELGELAPATARPLALTRLQAAGTGAAGGQAAVRIVAKLKTDEALEALVTATLAGNHHALRALTTYKHPRTMARLLAQLTPDRLGQPGAEWIVGALGGRGDLAALPPLLELWRSGSPPRPALAQSLLNLGAPEGLADLADCLADPASIVRDLAILAAERLGPAAAYDRLSPWLTIDRIQTAAGRDMGMRILRTLAYPPSRELDPRWMGTWRALTSRNLGLLAWPIQSSVWRMAWTPLLQQGGAALYEGTAWLFAPTALARAEAAASASSLLQHLGKSEQPPDERWLDRLLSLLEDPAPPYPVWMRQTVEHALQEIAAAPGLVPETALRRALRALQPDSRFRHRTVVLLASRHAGLPPTADPTSPAALGDAIAALSGGAAELAELLTMGFLSAPQPAIRQAAATALAQSAGPGVLASLLMDPAASPEAWESARQALQDLKQEVVVPLFDRLPPDAATQLGHADQQPGWEDRNRSRVGEILALLLARIEETRREPRARAFLLQIWNTHPAPGVRHVAGVAALRLEDPACLPGLIGDAHYTGHDFTKHGYRAVVILALRHVGNQDPARAFELAAPLYHPDRLAPPGGKSLAAETLQSFLPEPYIDPRNDPYAGWRPPTWTVYAGITNYEIPAYLEMKSDPRWYDRCAAFVQDEQVCQGLLAGDGGENTAHRLSSLLHILSETRNRDLTPIILNGLDMLLTYGEQAVAQFALNCVDQLRDPASIPKVEEWQGQGRLGGPVNPSGKTAADYVIERLNFHK